MSELTKQALGILMLRKEIMHKLKLREQEMQLTILEQFSKLILDVFNVSNEEENPDFLVWKIKVSFSKELGCKAFVQSQADSWIGIDELSQNNENSKTLQALKEIEVFDKMTLQLFNKLQDYLYDQIGNFFEITATSEDEIIISIKQSDLNEPIKLILPPDCSGLIRFLHDNLDLGDIEGILLTENGYSKMSQFPSLLRKMNKDEVIYCNEGLCISYIIVKNKYDDKMITKIEYDTNKYEYSCENYDIIID